MPDNAQNTLSALVTANLQILASLGALTDKADEIVDGKVTLPEQLATELATLKELSISTADAVLAVDGRIGDELKNTLKLELQKNMPKDQTEALTQLIQGLMVMQDEFRRYTTAITAFTERVDALEKKVDGVTDLLIDASARLNTLDIRMSAAPEPTTVPALASHDVSALTDAVERLKRKTQ